MPDAGTGIISNTGISISISTDTGVEDPHRHRRLFELKAVVVAIPLA